MVFYSAEILSLFNGCCAVVGGVGTPLAYVTIAINARKLEHELYDYFECECLGSSSNEICDVSGLERFMNPLALIILYGSLALYPVFSLIYVMPLSKLLDYFKRIATHCSKQSLKNSVSSSRAVDSP